MGKSYDDRASLGDSQMDVSQIDMDASQQIGQHAKGKYKSSGQGAQGLGYLPNEIPQSALTGKTKSLIYQLNIKYRNNHSIKETDKKPFDNFFRFLKDDKDWVAFCKILFLYFEGVLSLMEFFKLFEAKFSNKVR